MRLIMLALVLFALDASAQTPTPRPPQSLSMFLQGQYATLKRNVTGAAEKMPAEHFGFRPTADVRTYAQLFAHTIETQFFFCNAVKGGPDPSAGKKFEETVTEKAAIIQLVKDGFAYCDDVFAGITDEKLVSMIELGSAPNTRKAAAASQVSMVVIHGNEHYGNIVTYLRLKGIVPPSSAQ